MFPAFLEQCKPLCTTNIYWYLQQEEIFESSEIVTGITIIEGSVISGKECFRVENPLPRIVKMDTNPTHRCAGRMEEGGCFSTLVTIEEKNSMMETTTSASHGDNICLSTRCISTFAVCQKDEIKNNCTSSVTAIDA